MKILQVLPALEQGGVEWDAVELAQSLQARGVENGVASAGGAMVEKLHFHHNHLLLDVSPTMLTLLLHKVPWVHNAILLTEHL